MPTIVMGLLSGVLFGAGLAISGMTNPAKVHGFLDVFGAWDPSLAFVMGGALAVTVPGFFILKKRYKPVLAAAFQWPSRQDLDPDLIRGATFFGIGWGLAGFCPGPAIAGLAYGVPEVAIFTLAMLGGMFLFQTKQRLSETVA